MTATTPARTSLLLRIGLLAASFCAVACDAETQDSTGERDQVCAPEDGCDGIADVQERDGAQSASVEPNLTSERRTHGPPTDEDSLTTAQRANPALPTALPLAGYSCDRDEPEMSYLADDPETCATILITCEAGWQSFATGCGCGCEFTGEGPDDLRIREE